MTGGSAPMGTGAVGVRPTVIAAVAPMAPWPPTTDVVVAPWRRNEYGPTTGLKTISYADNVIAHRYAHAQGADEAVFANTRGQLCEGTGTNVVLAVDGRLVTPTLSSGCLAGVRANCCSVAPRDRAARRPGRCARRRVGGVPGIHQPQRPPDPPSRRRHARRCTRPVDAAARSRCGSATAGDIDP